jgi:hypothetical protein
MMQAMLFLKRTRIELIGLTVFVSARLFAAQPAAAAPASTTRYVRPTGKDLNNTRCHLVTPCKTIGHVISIANPGD